MIKFVDRLSSKLCIDWRSKSDKWWFSLKSYQMSGCNFGFTSRLFFNNDFHFGCELQLVRWTLNIDLIYCKMVEIPDTKEN